MIVLTTNKHEQTPRQTSLEPFKPGPFQHRLVQTRLRLLTQSKHYNSRRLEFTTFSPFIISAAKYHFHPLLTCPTLSNNFQRAPTNSRSRRRHAARARTVNYVHTFLGFGDIYEMGLFTAFGRQIPHSASAAPCPSLSRQLTVIRNGERFKLRHDRCSDEK